MENLRKTVTPEYRELSQSHQRNLPRSAIQTCYDLESEMGLLGIIMTDNSLIWDVCDIVKPSDFFEKYNADLFEACVEKIISGGVASPVSLQLKFANHPELAGENGKNYMVSLLDAFFSKLNLKEYAVRIADLSGRRRLLQMAEDVLETVTSDPRPANDITSDIISRFSDNSPKSEIAQTKKQVAKIFLESLEKPKDCYKTGLNCLDSAMGGGVFAGFTYGLAGQEKRGKTTLAHTISHNLNQSGVLHAYIALEMGSIQIEARNQARMAGVNSLAFLQESMRSNLDVKRRIAENIEACPDNTIYLNMAGGSLMQIQSELLKLISKQKIKGFILDYWQLVTGVPKGQTKSDFLFDVAQWMANFSKKHDIFCILLSQINREGLMFGSSGIEKACDQLYTIELPEVEGITRDLWLKMTHSRYTPIFDVGSSQNPALTVNTKAGPFIEDILR